EDQNENPRLLSARATLKPLWAWRCGIGQAAGVWARAVAAVSAAPPGNAAKNTLALPAGPSGRAKLVSAAAGHAVCGTLNATAVPAEKAEFLGVSPVLEQVLNQNDKKISPI